MRTVYRVEKDGYGPWNGDGILVGGRHGYHPLFPAPWQLGHRRPFFHERHACPSIKGILYWFDEELQLLKDAGYQLCKYTVMRICWEDSESNQLLFSIHDVIDKQPLPWDVLDG